MAAWHKHFHSDILASYASLPVDLRGVAYTILDLIYDRGGPLAESDAMLAARMCCSLRKWKSYKSELLRLGKFTLTPDGKLMNKRAENELKIFRKQAEFGSAGGRARVENAKNSKENNETDQDTLQASLQGKPETRSQIGTDVPSSEDKSSDVPSPKVEGEPTQTPPPPADREIVWNIGREILTKAGSTAKAAGALLGALVKAKGEAKAAGIVMAMKADPPLDPASYLAGCIHARPGHRAEQSGVDTGAAPRVEMVIGEDGKPVLRPIRRAA